MNILQKPTDAGVTLLQDELGLPRFFAEILNRRGIHEGAQLDLSLQRLLPPTDLPNVERAAARIVQAVDANERILIAGDYDVDGATSTAVCVSFFRAIRHKNITYAVPNRFRDGYGLTTTFVESFLEQRPNVVITVDNGISSVDGVAFANSHDIDVIVTDHHLPPEKLPDAYALVDPYLNGSTFEGALAGVGVAFYLMSVVRRQLQQNGYFARVGVNELRMDGLLDLVALGTVVDLAPLDHNNRVLVKQGIRRMQRGPIRPGLQALCETAGVTETSVTTSDLAFRLGPRINAAGRLDDMSTGIRLLLAEERREAKKLAVELHGINQKRRQLQSQMSRDAEQFVEDFGDDRKNCYCIFKESFNEGVVGLVASRIVEKTHVPVVAFANDTIGSDVQTLKGSARSVDGIHIRDVIADIHSRHPSLVLKFGGHAMAAGLTVRKVNLERFKALLEKAIAERTDSAMLTDGTYSDGELHEDELSFETTALINAHEPWGQAFPRPVFHGDFAVVAKTVVGQQHLKMTLRRGSRVFDAIAFNHAMIDAAHVQIVYELEENEFRDRRRLQLLVRQLEELAPELAA